MSDWKNVQYKDGKMRTSEGGGGGASALADLTDVNLTNIQDGQIIKWDDATQKFVNANESGGGSGGGSITTLSSEIISTLNQSYNLSDDISNYDFVIFHAYYTGGDNYPEVITSVFVPSQVIAQDRRIWASGGNSDRAVQLKFPTNTTVILLNTNQNAVKGIYGIKLYGNSNTYRHDYSTTEQVIGTWINGKPIYEIVLQVDTKTNAYATIDVSSLNIDIPLNADIFGRCTLNGTDFTLGSYFQDNNDGINTYLQSNKTTLVVRSKSNYPRGENMYVVLRYTKTTD